MIVGLQQANFKNIKWQHRLYEGSLTKLHETPAVTALQQLAYKNQVRLQKTIHRTMADILSLFVTIVHQRA